MDDTVLLDDIQEPVSANPKFGIRGLSAHCSAQIA